MLPRWVRLASGSCGLLLLPLATLAAQATTVIPRPIGMVNDFANVIQPDQRLRIEGLLKFVRERSKGEITVVTLADIGGRDVGTEALRIGREWKVGADTKIGDTARNAGTVILLVPKETSTDGSGHISITTGQGTEGFITDGIAGDIRREATPLLAQRRYGDGLELIAQRVAERYAANFGFSIDSAGPVFPRRSSQATSPQRERGGVSFGLVKLLPIVFIILFILLTSGRRGGGSTGCLWFLLGQAMSGGGRGGGWGGGGFGGGGGGGGGFGGFGGGGGFSGGGSSGSF